MLSLSTYGQSASGAVRATPVLTDEEIVHRVSSGDVQMFEILMQRHNQRLYRAVRAILEDDAEAEDVVQQAYLNAYRHLDQFEGRAQFSTWLTRIAVYEALARRRRVGVTPTSSEHRLAETVASGSPDPERAGVCEGTERPPGIGSCRTARWLPVGVHAARSRRSKHRRDGPTSAHQRSHGQDTPSSREGPAAAEAARSHARWGVQLRRRPLRQTRRRSHASAWVSDFSSDSHKPAPPARGSYFDGHFAMTPFRSTSNPWGPSRPFSTTSAPPLNVSGTTPVYLACTTLPLL